VGSLHTPSNFIVGGPNVEAEKIGVGVKILYGPIGKSILYQMIPHHLYQNLIN